MVEESILLPVDPLFRHSSPPAGVLRAAGLRKRQQGPFLEAIAEME
jgi:hypothetical protein